MLYMAFAPSAVTFFISVMVGVALGAIWDCFRVVRKKIGDLKKLVFILDLTYFILVSICTMCFFFFFTYGGFRAFALIGELLGFILFYSTFEKPVFPLIYFFVSIAFKITYFFYKIIKFSFLKFINFSEKVIIYNLKNLQKKLNLRKKNNRSRSFKNRLFKSLNLRKKQKNGRKNKKK